MCDEPSKAVFTWLIQTLDLAVKVSRNELGDMGSNPAAY